MRYCIKRNRGDGPVRMEILELLYTALSGGGMNHPALFT